MPPFGSDYAYRRRHQQRLPSAAARLLRRTNSASTLYVADSTVSQPNLKVTIKAVSLAVYFHIKNRRRQKDTRQQLLNSNKHQNRQLGTDRDRTRELEIFDERTHPILV